MTSSKPVSVHRNMLANYVSRGWSALMGLAFIPLYARLLGVEAMGVIGLFVTLQAICLLLDAGLSTTLNRELARMTLFNESPDTMRNLVRTFEVPFWGASFLGGLFVFALAPFLANHWVHVQTLSPALVQTSIRLMGLVLFFQLPLSLYGGGLLGLQRQVEYSLLTALWYTLRFAGAIVALKLFGASLFTFFAWQVLVAVIATGLCSIVLWRSLPKSPIGARVDASLLSSRWKFAAGLGAISITLLILNNVDKVILSRAISLEAFGYYTLGWTLANAIRLFADPLFITFFPRLSQAWASQDSIQLSRLYRSVCSLMAVAILPIGLTLAFFAPEAVLLWTRSPLVVENTSTLVSLLAIGNVCLALTIVPYALQLASGWTSLALWSNVVAVIVLIPLMSVLASAFGALGGGLAWVLLNSIYLVATVAIMHRRILPGHLRTWILNDIGQAFVAVLAVLGIARLLIHHSPSTVTAFLVLATVFVSAQAAALAASPLRAQIQQKILSFLTRTRSNYSESKQPYS